MKNECQISDPVEFGIIGQCNLSCDRKLDCILDIEIVIDVRNNRVTYYDGLTMRTEVCHLKDYETWWLERKSGIFICNVQVFKVSSE